MAHVLHTNQMSVTSGAFALLRLHFIYSSNGEIMSFDMVLPCIPSESESESESEAIMTRAPIPTY